MGAQHLDRASYVTSLLSLTLITYFFYLFFFIYNQIPPQSEENNMLHKNIDKIQE